jgi:hypothetical protein
LELCFGPSTYENHQAQLFKLRQTGFVSEYQENFEKLGNRVLGLPADAILNCFISGLIPEIRNEIAIQRPYSISEAIGLAKLIEAKNKDSKPKFQRSFHPQNNLTASTSNTNYSNNNSSTQSLPKPPIPSIPTQHNTTTTKLPIRRLTPAQMQERRAQGLCYNCDKKYVVGHRCATGRYLLLILEAGEDFDHDEAQTEQEGPINSAETYFQLSHQTLTGQFSPQTLKFQGQLHGLAVTVLIDTGSTHNILQPRIVTHLQIPHEPMPNFSVMVGNGSHI